MYKVKTKISSSGSTKEFDIIGETYPSIKSRAHLILLRTRYRKLDDYFFLTRNDKNYVQYIFNRDFARRHKKKYGELTCSYCGGTNLIIPEKRKISLTKQATVDHFFPKGAGGDAFNEDNLVIACGKCNHDKGDKIYGVETLKYTPTEVKEKIIKYLKKYHEKEINN